jgi:lipoprotein-anchoring transpeptidase ErfK/SrfK
MSLHRKLMLAALCTATIGGSIPLASAQTCDDRYPASCRGFIGPAPQANRAGSPFFPFFGSSRPTVEPAPTAPEHPDFFARPSGPENLGRYASLYAPLGGERFPIPAVNLTQLDPQFLRQSVFYPTSEPAGTIIINPREHFLYLVQGGGRAIRYGVGVGRQGFGWSGTATIREKREWPDWYPPKEMIERQPEIRKQLTELQSGIGMAGGPRNPLGPRALYLWQGDKDTLFRIHGTVEPWTIGKSASSGCIRMINQDAIDLYNRTPEGTRVVVIGSTDGPVG